MSTEPGCRRSVARLWLLPGQKSACFAEIASRRFTGTAVLLDLIVDLLAIN